MANKYLMQDDFNLVPNIFEYLNKVLVETGSKHLTFRKVFDVVGPMGADYKSVYIGEEKISENLSVGKVKPLYNISKPFSISKIALSSFEKDGFFVELKEFIEAVKQVCKLEDEIILKELKGQEYTIDNWKEDGKIENDITWMIRILEDKDLIGPYYLILNSELYSYLLKRYENTSSTKLDYVKNFVSKVIVSNHLDNYKGILMSESQYKNFILLGQDISIGFVGPEISDFVFYISESFAFVQNDEEAVLLLK